MTAFWREIVDHPDALPPEFWQLSLQSNVREKMPAGFRDMTWRRPITAEAMRQRRPRSEEVHREMRRFEVAVFGGAKGCGSQRFQHLSEGRRGLKRRPTACQRSRRCGQVLWETTL